MWTGVLLVAVAGFLGAIALVRTWRWRRVIRPLGVVAAATSLCLAVVACAFALDIIATGYHVFLVKS
jgi:hypothetical protein